MVIFLSFRNPGLTTFTDFPSTIASTPLPVMALNFSALGMATLCSFTLLIIPTAIGCSDVCSKALANLNISSFENSVLTDTNLVTPKTPVVNVPVLSNRSAVIFLDSSKAVLLRINKPFCADTAVEMATTRGIAKPNAWGQAITITVTIRSNANTNGYPAISQTANVPKPTDKAI